MRRGKMMTESGYLKELQGEGGSYPSVSGRIYSLTVFCSANPGSVLVRSSGPAIGRVLVQLDVPAEDGLVIPIPFVDDIYYSRNAYVELSNCSVYVVYS